MEGVRHVTRHAGPWLAVAWMVGTAAAVVVAVFAVNLAGSKVTTRPIASLSRQNVEEATAGDATVVVANDATAESLGTDTLDDHGATAGGSGDTERSGGDASSGSGSASGSGSSTATVADDGGGGSGTGGSGTPGGSGTSTHDGSTTTTEAEHESVTTTTAAPSGPVSKTVSGNTVTVQCSGSSVTLMSTVAAKPYAKQVKSTGPVEVVVRFTSATAEEVEVHATCSGGAVHWDD